MATAKKAPAKKAPAKKSAQKGAGRTIGYTTSNVFPAHSLKEVWAAAVEAKHLKKHPKVSWVNYAGLEDHPDHHLVKSLLGGRASGLLTFGVMAATIAVLTFAYGLGATLLTHFLAERMRANPVVGRVLEKVAGVFLIGFGVKLALSK